MRRRRPRAVSAAITVFVLALSGICPAGSGEPAPWWNGDWKYRLPLRVTSRSGTALGGHVDLVLDGSLFPLYGADPDMDDFRVVCHSGGEHRLLHHFIDDRRITNGAWFACCKINDYTQYHGPAATYYTNLRPNAIRYSGAHDRTYFVYGDFSRDPAIQFYDHDTKTLSPPVICGRTQIPDDAHGNPSMMIDDDGYIYVFFGCHHHPIQMVRSVEPECIRDWTGDSLISDLATYPQPCMIGPGKMLLSFRWKSTVFGSTAGWAYTVSKDGGATWSGEREIVTERYRYIYAITEVGSEAAARSFHVAFTPFDYTTKFYSSIYYLYSDDGLSTFRHRSGLNVGSPPLTVGNAELVFDSGDRSSHVVDMVLDEDNMPYILFNTGPWNQVAMPGDGEFRVARFAEGSWRTAYVAPCDNLFDRGCLLVREDGHLVAYLPVDVDYRDGGEMVEYRSADGGETWEKRREITSGSEYSHNYAVRVRNADPGFRVLWSYGTSDYCYSSWRDEPSEVFLHGDGGFLNGPGSGLVPLTVRAESVPADGDLYLYFGNAGAAGYGDMTSCLQDGYARDLSGEADTTLLLEWLMDASGDTLIDTAGNANDGCGNVAIVPGGGCPGRRYDLEWPGSVARFDEGSFAGTDSWHGPATVDGLSVEIRFRCDGIDGVRPLAHCPSGFNLFLRQGLPIFRVNYDGIELQDFHLPHIVPGVWHHLVGAWDGTSVFLYLDGRRSCAMYDRSAAGPVHLSGVVLGALDTYSLSGDVDEVRIYSRALGGDEVMARYLRKSVPDFACEPGAVETFVPGEQRGCEVFVSGAWPNPSASAVNIEYHTAAPGNVGIDVYDAAGRKVRTLLRHARTGEGYHRAEWDGRNDGGRLVASGVFFCRISVNGDQAVTRLVVIR